MAEEIKTIDEKELSEPFKKLNDLPIKTEEITDNHKEEAEKLFNEIIESVKSGHAVSIAEYNALSRVHKIYEFNTFLKGIEEEKQQAFAAELTNAGNRKVKTTALDNFVKPIRTTSNQDLKKELNKRIAALNTALAKTNGDFTAEQVKQLQDFLEPYKKNDKIKVNIDKLFMDVIKPERGKPTATPAFTALYNQVAPQQPSLASQEIANELGDALRQAGESLSAETQNDGAAEETSTENTSVQSAQEDEVVEPTEVINQDAENTDEEETERGLTVFPLNTDENELTVTAEEINEYIAELKNFNNEDSYLNNISPKISEEAILAAMALDKTDAVEAASELDDAGRPLEEISPAQPEVSATENRAIALSNPDDMLVALDYFENKYQGDDKDAKIADLKDVIKENLTKYEAKDINPESAFVLATLADKIKGNEETPDAAYTQITEQIALSQKAYDIEHFGELLEGETKEQQAERLNKNYTVGLEALEALDAEKTLAMLKGYTFTNDKGKKLEGKKERKVQESVIETARLMVAQDLAKEGLPQDIQDDFGHIKTVNDQLLEKMQEKIDLIMAPSIDENIQEAIDEYITSEFHLDKDSEEFANMRASCIKAMQHGDQANINAISYYQTRKEMGLSPQEKIPEDRRKEFDKKREKNIAAIKNNVSYSYSDIGGRLGGAMVAGPETFKTRVTQKFKDTPFYQTVHGKWQTLDKKLEENKHFGQAYINGKKVAKYVGKIAPGILKSSAQFAVAGLVPGGVPALIAYNTYKQYKQLKQQLKETDSKAKKRGMIVSMALTSTLSAVTAVTGTAGVLSSFGIDFNNPAVMQGIANFGTHIGAAARVGISAVAASIPNWIEKRSLKKEEKKIQKQLATEKDPAKLKELSEKQKKLQIAKTKNRNDWIKKAIGVAVGLTVAQGVSAATNGGNQSDIPNTPDNTPPTEQNAQTPQDNANVVVADSVAQTTPEVVNNAENTAAADSAEATSETVNNAEANAGDANADNANADNSNDNNEAALNAEEQKAQNLAAASEKGSGHMGKSDMESMQKDLDSHHGAKLAYTPEEKVALMKSLAEGYGTDSYEAMHAAMAEPRILAAQMGITADVEASAQAAGIDTSTQYSKAVLNHLAIHPELADNEGFKAYVAEHFDEQDRFHSSNYTVHTQTHHTSHTTVVRETPAPASTENTQSSGFRYEVVDHLPGQHQQPVPEQVVHVVNTTPTVHTPENNGLIYDPLLSEGLDHSKYQGAYLDPSRMIGGKPAVVYVPNDTLHDNPVTTNMDDAIKAHDHAGGDTLGIYRSRTGIDINNPENNYGYYGYGSRVCYGSGYPAHTTVSTRDISFGEALGREAAVRVTDIALRQGEHALAHAIENALGRGRH